MDSSPQFELCILSATWCELRDESGKLIEAFSSVKGALDFLGDVSEVSIHIKNERRGKELEMDLPGRFNTPRPEQRSALHIE